MVTGLPPGSGLPDVNRGPRILGAITTTTILALITVAMRLYVRIWMLRKPGFDDYFMIASMTCSLFSFGIIVPDVVIYGAGRHAAYISPSSKIATGMKLNFFTQFVLLAGVSSAKVSIGFSLLRIAPNNWYRRSIIGANTFLLVTTVFFLTVQFTTCRPLAAVWDSSLHSTATCWDEPVLEKIIYANSALNIATDLIFALVPWPILWNLRIEKRIKIALLAVMSLGIFACAAGAMKLTYISTSGLYGDFLYDSADLSIWSSTEMNVGILAGSIPCLKPLFRVLLEKSGHVPKDNPLAVPVTSYFAPTTDIVSSQENSDQSRTEIRVEQRGTRVE